MSLTLDENRMCIPGRFYVRLGACGILYRTPVDVTFMSTVSSDNVSHGIMLTKFDEIPKSSFISLAYKSDSKFEDHVSLFNLCTLRDADPEEINRYMNLVVKTDLGKTVIQNIERIGGNSL